MGRDMAYDCWSCDLLCAASSPDLYRINLEKTQDRRTQREILNRERRGLTSYCRQHREERCPLLGSGTKAGGLQPRLAPKRLRRWSLLCRLCRRSTRSLGGRGRNCPAREIRTVMGAAHGRRQFPPFIASIGPQTGKEISVSNKACLD